ncbi:hypothetical protein CVT26_014390 [Gymnopilus dilepis]|uniref:Uncharacterized protein n=1 Tax=Gymnopilus dilepis TaxID=231916 RepID=A0A409Y7Q3_9AGAR|nr:hypothetical protein CVT26_014390 [Gymnopilus dilepis]
MVSSKTSTKAGNTGGGAGNGRARGGISGPKLKKSAVIDALSTLEPSGVSNVAAANLALMKKEVNAGVVLEQSPATVRPEPANKKKSGDAADKKSSGGNPRKNSSPSVKQDIAANQSLTLRASRNPHPGLPDAPRPKRSSEVVAAERTDKAMKKEQSKERRSNALAKAAAIEDKMVEEDQALAASNGISPPGLPERQRKTRPKPGLVQESTSQELADDVSGDSSSEGYQQPEGEESSGLSEAADESDDEEMLDVSEEEEKPKPKKAKKSKGDVRKGVAENRKVVDKNKKRRSEEKRQ